MTKPTLGEMVFIFFEKYLKNERGLRANTIVSYSTCVRLLFQFACDQLDKSIDQLGFQHLDENLILKFLDDLETKRANLPQTRNNRLAAIRTFFRFLASQDPCLKAVCERICAISLKRVDHCPPMCLSREEVDAFLQAPNSNDLWGKRDLALIWLLYNTGARVQELVDLHLCDIQLDLAELTLTGKGGRQRSVPIWPETVKVLRCYLEFREQAGIKHSRLFLNRCRHPITRFGIGYLIRGYKKEAEKKCPFLVGKKVTPHSFRHATALHLLQAGNHLSVVKDWLGHADINTTHQYLEINMEMKRKALEAAEPLTIPRSEPRWRKPDILNFLEQLEKNIA